MQSLRIDTLPTPNPDAMMFKVEVPLVERGTFEFNAPEKAGNSALPKRLFAIDGVDQVLVTSRFVTVNKTTELPWHDLVSNIKGAIRAHLASGDPAVEDQPELTALVTDSELARQIVELIDEEVRPALAQDGGDVQFVGLTAENVVQLRLIGACSSCPSSSATLAFGIERLLVEEFPDIQGVVQV
jgi:Fe-S cluster biogenesis protein NfuA